MFPCAMSIPEVKDTDERRPVPHLSRMTRICAFPEIKYRQWKDRGYRKEKQYIVYKLNSSY